MAVRLGQPQGNQQMLFCKLLILLPLHSPCVTPSGMFLNWNNQQANLLLAVRLRFSGTRYLSMHDTEQIGNTGWS